MSAYAEVLPTSGFEEMPEAETAFSQTGNFSETTDWNSGDFAQEQIRNLVRRVFFSDGVRAPKQIAFSATEVETDMAYICDQVGCALSLETTADVAIVDYERFPNRMRQVYPRFRGPGTIKSRSTQSATNLWRVPASGIQEYTHESHTGSPWPSGLRRLRAEFEFSIIQAPVAGISSEALMLGQLADGIVLVLGAHHTRRAAARKIKETLEGARCRILGTVLSGRKFPIPEGIYRRL